MIDLDQVVLRRAEEQARAYRPTSQHERDSWAIAGDEEPPAKRPPAPCRAPGCGRRSRATGYCHMHGRRLARGLPLERDDSEPGRVPGRVAHGRKMSGEVGSPTVAP